MAFRYSLCQSNVVSLRFFDLSSDASIGDAPFDLGAASFEKKNLDSLYERKKGKTHLIS